LRRAKNVKGREEIPGLYVSAGRLRWTLLLDASSWTSFRS